MFYDQLSEYLAAHRTIAIGLLLLWAWVSCTLILRLWIVHRREPLARKVVWTLVLAVPVFGWLCYGGLFQMPERSGAESFGEHSSTGNTGD